MRRALILGCVGVALSLGCGAEATSPTPTPIPPTPTAVSTPNLAGPFPYETLSEYGLFREPMSELQPVSGVLPYEPVSPLWTDGAVKPRFIVVPPGSTVTFEAEAGWDWPTGTLLVKNFLFGLDERDPEGTRRVVETRLLEREADGTWTAHTYLWDEDQSEARRTVAGARVTLDRVDAAGEPWTQTYLVPNTNQCGNCHEVDDLFHPLGPVTEQMNHPVVRDGAEVPQLEWLAAQGLFAAPPPTSGLRALVDPQGTGALESRARSYLHANCAHCHQPGGGAHKSGLFLSAFEQDPQAYGVCKPPVAAGGGAGGLEFDIVPGAPDESILVHRMSSTDPDVKMPEIGNLYVDPAGLALVREWIAGMEPLDCETYGATPTP